MKDALIVNLIKNISKNINRKSFIHFYSNIFINYQL